MSHTPGPWEHHDGEITHHGAMIGTVFVAEDFPCLEEPEKHKAEYEANAHLIVAAPDLLTALELASRALDRCPVQTVGMSNLRRIRMALAKAKGEA